MATATEHKEKMKHKANHKSNPTRAFPTYYLKKSFDKGKKKSSDDD